MTIGDFFKPIWRNSNTELRLEHLIRQSKTEKYQQGDSKTIKIIKNLATTDPDNRVVALAISLIRKPEDFKDILSSVKTASNRNFIIKEIEKNFPKWGWDLETHTKRKFLSIFKDQELSKEILVREPSLWKEEVGKINDQNLVCEIFERSTDQDQDHLQHLVNHVNIYPILKTMLSAYQNSKNPFHKLIQMIQDKLVAHPEYQKDQEVIEQNKRWDQLNSDLNATLQSLQDQLQQNNFQDNPPFTLDYFYQNRDLYLKSPAITEEMAHAFEEKVQKLKNIIREWEDKKSNYQHSIDLAQKLVKITQEIDTLINSPLPHSQETETANPSRLDWSEEEIEEYLQTLHSQLEALFTQAEEVITTLPEEMYSIPVISQSRDEYIAKKNRLPAQVQKIKERLSQQKKGFDQACQVLEEQIKKVQVFLEKCEQDHKLDLLNPQLNTYRQEWDEKWREIIANFPETSFQEQKTRFQECFHQCSKKINDQLQRRAIEHKQQVVKLNKEIKDKTLAMSDALVALENNPKSLPQYRQEDYSNFLKTLEPYQDELSQELIEKYQEELVSLKKKILEIQEDINRDHSINLDKRMKLYALLEESATTENKEKLVELIKEIQIKWKKIGPIAKKDSVEWNQKFDNLCQKILQENSEVVKEFESKLQNQIQQKKDLINRIHEVESQCPKFNEKEWRTSLAEINTIIEQWKKIRILSDEDTRELNFEFKNHLDAYHNQRSQYFTQLKEIRSKKIEEKQKILEELSTHQIKSNDTTPSQDSQQSKHSDYKKIDWKILKKKIFTIINRWKTIGVAYPFSENKALDQQFQNTLEEILQQYGEGVEVRMQLKEKLWADLNSIEKSLQENQDPAHVKSQVQKLFEIKQNWDRIIPTFSKKHQKFNSDFYSLYKKILSEHQVAVDSIQEDRRNNLQEKQKLLNQLEEVMGQEKTPETSKKIIEIQQKWKNIGPIPAKMYGTVEKPFYQKTSYYFKLRSEEYRQTRNTRQENYEKKQSILSRVKYLLQDQKNSNDTKVVVDSAEKLKMAWEINRQLRSAGGENQQKKIREEVGNLKKEWKKIGPTFSDRKLNDEFYGLIRNIKWH